MTSETNDFTLIRWITRLKVVINILGVTVEVEILRIGNVVDKIGRGEVEVSKVNGLGRVIGVEVLVNK